MRSQEHQLRLFLNAKMHLALIKLQATQEIGPVYAGLYAINEGLHSLKHLSDEDYKAFKNATATNSWKMKNKTKPKK